MSSMSTRREAPAQQPPGLQTTRVTRVARTFKVIEVATGTVLAEGSDTRTTIDLLSRVDSIFDVEVCVWHPAASAWRPLTPGEQRTLWDFRGR